MINFGGVSLTGKNYIDFNGEEVCSVFWEENGKCSQVWPDRNYWLMEETSTDYNRPLYSLCYLCESLEEDINVKEGTIKIYRQDHDRFVVYFCTDGSFTKTAHYHLQNTSNNTITYKIKYKDSGILKFSPRSNTWGGTNGDVYYFTNSIYFNTNFICANTNCFTLGPFSEVNRDITLINYNVASYNNIIATVYRNDSLVIECVPPYIDIEITDENNNVLFCCDCAQAKGILSGELPRVYY